MLEVGIGLAPFFGLVQSIESAIEMCKAYHAKEDSPLQSISKYV
jgi:hypothetical protein